ncbi:hypothetical protein CHMI_03423 [Cellulomonas hominis]|nr:hypothetical protein CHMI_03423 [Cellulomonas hominis]
MTTGTGAGNAATASATSTCGAMIAMPSTAWSRKWSSAARIVPASNRSIAATLT